MILEKLHLDPKNCMSFMQQETARSFLSCGPRKNYALLERSLGLGDVEAGLALMEEQLRQNMLSVRIRQQEMRDSTEKCTESQHEKSLAEKAGTIGTEMRRQEAECAWARYREAREAANRAAQDLLEIPGSEEESADQNKTMQEAIREAKVRHSDVGDRLSTLYRKTDQLRVQRQQIGLEIQRFAKEHCMLDGTEAAANRGLIGLETSVRVAQSNFREAMDAGEAGRKGQAGDRGRALDEIRSQIALLQAEVSQNEGIVEALSREADGAYAGLARCLTRRRELEQTVTRLEAKLRQLESSGSERAARLARVVEMGGF